MTFFQGTEELVRNSHGKRAISVRAIEVLLYLHFIFTIFFRYAKLLIKLGLSIIYTLSHILN